MKILSRDEMYFYDNFTMQEMGIPSRVLMEIAGKGCADYVKVNHKDKSKILCVCGAGNNGGDGFVIARWLLKYKYDVMIFRLGSESRMSPETKANFNLCQKLNIPIFSIKDDADLKRVQKDMYFCDLIIDTIFGIGFTGTPKPIYRDTITMINKSNKHILAIDIPSGTDSNTGEVICSIIAKETLAIESLKYGHILGDGREVSGKITVIPIGIPDVIFDENPPSKYLVDDQNVVYPERNRFSHKGSYGKIGIIAGSPGYSGAAIMATRSALRSGAGLVTLLHPESMSNIFENQLLEAMTLGFSEDSPGKAFDIIWDRIVNLDAILVGPGIGTSDFNVKLLDMLIKKWDKPLVLDADALNIISSNKGLLDNLNGKDVLLTPHIGEFSRLTGKTIEEIQQNPIEALENFTSKYNVSVLLKSATTIFTNNKDWVFDISGNDGLATGGSGDVLSGIIISFIGQGLSIKDAAVGGSYILGKTAEKLLTYRNTPSILPSDIIKNLFRIK